MRSSTKTWLGNGFCVVLIVLLLGGMILPNRRDLFGTRFRFHPVTGESERLRLWFGMVVAREREKSFEWYTDHCGGQHAADDDPLWRNADGSSIYGSARVWVRNHMEIMELHEVPAQDRCVVIRYQIEHPSVPILCETVDGQESLRWWSGQDVVMRWEKGKEVEILEKLK